MRCSLLLGGFLALLALSSAKVTKAKQEDFVVYKVLVSNKDQLNGFKNLGEQSDIVVLDDVDSDQRFYDVAVAAEKMKEIEKKLKELGLIYKEKIESLKDKLLAHAKDILNPKMEWTAYHPLEDIYNWVDAMALRHPFSIKRYTIGQSYEGRPIKAIKISRRPGNKAIFVESHIHAIEWISSAAGTCFFNNLLTSTDPDIQELTLNYDWIYVPVVNPDGLEFTRNVEPLWRKNRRPTGFYNSSGICYGTDMNRNFDYMWKVAGHNVDDPCDHWYAGSAPATEPEVQALMSFVDSFPDDYIRMYLALHAYGNYLLLPYGHTNTEFPPNYDQMMRIAQGFADAAKVKYGTEFTYGASGLLNYPVSGSAKDWAYAVKGIPFTATVELRDKGKYGFFLPADQIVEVCAEITDGFVGMLKAGQTEELFN